MFHSLNNIYEETIYSPLCEYLMYQQDTNYFVGRLISRASELARNTFHFSDHWEKKDSSINRAVIREHCPRFSLLKSVADATKHRELTHHSAKIKQATDVEEAFNIIAFMDHEGQYQHAQPRVFVKLKDGKREDLISVIVEASNFYATRLHQSGILHLDRRIHYDGKFKFLYRYQVKATEVYGREESDNLMRIILWAYNPKTREFEEMDFEEGQVIHKGKVIQRTTKADAKPLPW